MGETSAGVIRMLSLAKPIVVSDVDAFAELPDEVAVKIAPDEREVDALVASLLQLVEDPSLAARMSAAAREFALREHDLARVADLYTSALEEAAGGAAVRDELLREVGAAAADVGVSDTREVAEALREVGLGR